MVYLLGISYVLKICIENFNSLCLVKFIMLHSNANIVIQVCDILQRYHLSEISSLRDIISQRYPPFEKENQQTNNKGNSYSTKFYISSTQLH